MSLERYQNPTPDDTVRLRLYTYNANNLADIDNISDISIYICDPSEITMENPDGKVLIQQLDTASVVHECVGTYYIDVVLTSPKYVIGKYFDQWTMMVTSTTPSQVVINEFRIFPHLWYTTPMPVVYDFNFDFQPNKIRKGSIQYIRIRVIPNVPKATDIQRYYENLATVGGVKVSIEQKCGPCLPVEADLRLIVDAEPVSYRERCYGYYKLDTVSLDLDCGIFAIWFSLELGGNLYLSDKYNLQIFE